MIGYTIGQRKGLGLALKKPMYVVEKDIENNRILLGENKDLMTKDFEAGCCNWISGSPPKGKIQVMAKTRYNQKESPAVVEVIGEASSAFFLQLELNDFTSIGSNPIDMLRRNIQGYSLINEPVKDSIYVH